MIMNRYPGLPTRERSNKLYGSGYGQGCILVTLPVDSCQLRVHSLILRTSIDDLIKSQCIQARANLNPGARY